MAEEIIKEEILPIEEVTYGNPKPVQKKYLTKIHQNLVDTFGVKQIPDEITFAKNIKDSNYAKLIYETLVDEYGIDEVSDFKSFSEKLTNPSPEKKNLGATIGGGYVPLESELSSIQNPDPFDKKANPSILARQSFNLKQPKSVAKKTVGVDMMGMPIESNEDIYDENSINIAKEIDKHLEKLGYSKDFASTISRIPEKYKEAAGYTDQELADLYIADKNEFNKRTSNILWRENLSESMNKMANDIDKNEDLTEEEKDAQINRITTESELLNQGAEGYAGDLKNKQYYVGQSAKNIKKFIADPKMQKQALEDLAISAADDFGSIEDLEDKNKLPLNKNINDYQSVGLNYLNQIDPEKAEFYKKYIDKDREKLKEFQNKGYDQLQKELDEIGLNLVINNAKNKLKTLSDIAKQQGGQLDPEDYEEYNKLLETANTADARLSKLGLIYPNTEDLDTRSIAQELTGGGYSTLGLAGKNLAYGLAKTGKGIVDIALSPFRSEQMNDNAALEALGIENYVASKTIPTRNQSALARDLPKITPELDTRIKNIKDDKKLSQDEKIDKVDQLLQSNRDKWIPASNETKWNLGPNAVFSSVANTAAKLAPFLAMEVLTQGTATPSLLGSFAKMYGNVLVTSYSEELGRAMQEKNSNPELAAYGNVLVNSLAFKAAGVGDIVKNIRGAASKAGGITEKIISKLDDKAILNALKNPNSTLKGFFNNLGSVVKEKGIEGVKTAVAFEGVLGGVDIMRGAEVDEEFVKQKALNLLSFSLFNTILGTSIGMSKIGKENKEALFLAATNKDEVLYEAEKAFANKQISPSTYSQIKGNVEAATKVLEKVPMVNGKGEQLSTKEASELMYLKIKEQYIENQIKKDLPKTVQAKITKDLADVQDEIDKVYKGTFIEGIGKPFEGLKDSEEKGKIKIEEVKPTEQVVEVKPTEVKEIGADIINNTESKILLPVDELNRLRTQRETDLATGNAIDLEKNLLKNGIKEPLVITYYPEEGKARLTDGHNRLDVAKDMGAENLPIRIVYDYGEAPSSAKDFILPTKEVKPTEVKGSGGVGGDVIFQGKRGQADSITFDGKTIKQGEEIELNDVNISQDDSMPDLRSGKYKVRMLSVDANGKTATLTLTDGNEVITTTVKDLRKSEQSLKETTKEEVKPTEVEEIPTDLEERGEAIESTLEAERRRSNGERIFAITEQDGTPVEVTSVEMLRNYTPDQLLAYKPSEIIKNKELEENKLILQNGTKEQGNGKDTGAANGGEMGGLEPSGEGVEVGLGAPSRYVVGKGNRVVRDVTTVKKISIPDSEAAEIKKRLPNAIFDDSFSEINSAEQFHKAISESLKGNKHSSSVFVYPISEYKNSRLFLTNDGKAGVAITKNGDIISVFSYGEGKNRVAQLLVNAVKDGGVSLDHYDTRLTDIYSQFGFVPVARVKFDRAEAPKTWDYELYKDYNKGEPDVIAMAYNGGDPNTLFERVGKFGDVNELLKKTPYVDTWEQAKKLQQEFVNKVKTEVEPSIQKDIKTQIEDFGVPKEDVEPVNTMLSNIYESLKKSGLTVANTLSEWVGIGKGTKEKGALFQPTIYGKSGIVKRPSFDKASADKAIKSGRVKVISPKKSLEDLTFAITHWDDLFVGDIFHNDKKIGSFDGGVFYPLNGGEKGKMGASVNPQSAGAFATQSNRSLFKNNGIKLPESFSEGTFIIEKGTNKNEWILTNKAGEKVTVNLPDNPKPGIVVIGKGDNLKHKSSLSAKIGFVNTLLSYAKGKEGYDGLINAIKSVYSIGNTRNADSVIDLFNNYLKSGRMDDGQTMSEAKTSYENFRAALIKDANPIITSMMRDMGYTEAEYFDGTQLKKGIYKATGKGIDKMFADLGQEDFLKGLKTGDAYAALKVTSPVFFEKDLSHPSYPFAIKTIDSSPVNIDIFNKTFRTFGENQGIEGRSPKEGQLVTEGFGVTTTTKPSFKIKQDIDLNHPSSIDLSGALGQYESVQRTQSLKQKANAQYRIESGKNIIEALREFNKAKDKGKAVVAITHEIMHPTVVEIISGAKDGNEIGKKHTQTIVDEFNKATGNKITVDELISGNDEFKGGKTTNQYRDVQEFIAESWEKYHTQGAKGFSAEFQKVLETITEAFKTVYKSLTGKELTPELRKMFDDILGKSEFKYEADIKEKGDKTVSISELSTEALKEVAISKKALGDNYNFSKEFDVRGGDVVATDVLTDLKEAANENKVDLNTQIANEVNLMSKGQPEPTERNIITAGSHLLNIDKKIAEAQANGNLLELENLNEQKNQVLSVLRTLGNKAGRNLGLFNLVFKDVDASEIKVTRDYLKTILNVEEVPETIAELDKSNLTAEQKKTVRPYIEKIEKAKNEFNELEKEVIKNISKINQDEFNAAIEKSREEGKKQGFAEGLKSVPNNVKQKKSKQIKDLASKIRSSDEFDKFLKGAGPLGGAQKASFIDIGSYKEIVANVLEAVASAIELGENVTEAIKKAADKFKNIDTAKLIGDVKTILSKSELPDRKDVMDKISKIAQAEGANNITKGIVDKGLIKDIINSYLGEDLTNNQVLFEATYDLQSILPNVKREDVADAYAERGKFKKETKAKIENEINQKKADVKRLAIKEIKLKALEAANDYHLEETKEGKKRVTSEYEEYIDEKIKNLLKEKNNIQKEQKVSKSPKTEQDKIDEINKEIQYVKDTKSVYEQAIKNPKKASEALLQARAEREKTYASFGLKLEKNAKAPILIERDFIEARSKVIDDMISGLITESEKDAKISELEAQKRIDLQGTKQGVVSSLSDDLNNYYKSNSDKSADAVYNEDYDKYRYHLDLRDKLYDIQKILSPTGQKLDDQINKAYNKLDKLFEDKSLDKEDLDAINKIKTDLENYNQLTLDELAAERLKKQWENEIKTAETDIAAGIFTKIPSTTYDYRRNDELFRLNKARENKTGQLNRMVADAKEKTRTIGEKALDLSTKFLVSGVHTAAKVAEAATFKPFMDSMVDLTAGRLASYITGAPYTSLYSVKKGYKTFAAFKNKEEAQKYIQNLQDKRDIALENLKDAFDNGVDIKEADKEFKKADLEYAVSTLYNSIESNVLNSFWQYMKHGATDYDVSIGKSSKKDISEYRTVLGKTGYVLDGWIRMHSAMKSSLSARPEMMKVFSSTLKDFQRKGMELNPENISTAMVLAADAYEAGRLTNKTALSKIISRGKGSEKSTVTRLITKGLMPVSTIAVNLAKRGIDYSTLGAEGFTRLATETKKGMKLNEVEGKTYDGIISAIKDGWNRIPLKERVYINGVIGRGLFGSAIMLATMYGLQNGMIKYGGTFEDQKKRKIMGSDDEQLKAGEWEFFGKRLPKAASLFLNHLPEFLAVSLIADNYQINQMGGTSGEKFETTIDEVEARLPFQTMAGLFVPGRRVNTLVDRFTRIPIAAETGSLLDEKAEFRDKSDFINRIRGNVGFGIVNPTKLQQQQIDDIKKELRKLPSGELTPEDEKDIDEIIKDIKNTDFGELEIKKAMEEAKKTKKE